jgi:hypothetical protein
MSALAIRQQLIATIDELPTESLAELVIFLEYLRFKTKRVTPKRKKTQPALDSSFLLAIAGIGASAETDLAERDEEILTAEIDPLRGWGLPRESLS